MSNLWLNKTILCVDDEEPVLESFKKVLVPEKKQLISEILSLASQRDESSAVQHDTSVEFDLILVSSGEEAVRIAEERYNEGHRIAGGFFDMRMPGGIDGFETIRQIKRIDPDIFCTVVTAYTDRSVGQIRDLFSNEHQDELLYFKKPFAPEELSQTAFNMVSSWNRKRKAEEHLRAIEKHKMGLSQILHAVSVLSRVPPHSLQYLSSGLLFQLLGVVDGEDGFNILFNKDGSVGHVYGVGRFEHDDQEVLSFTEEEVFESSFADDQLHMQEKSLFVPLVSGKKRLGAVYIESPESVSAILDRPLLEVFKTQMVQLVLNSHYYSEIVEKDRETVTDPLTGLYNRRFIQKRMHEELHRACRFSQRIAVMMIDLDDFKIVNDTYGHHAGDMVLRIIGKILRDSVRDYDLVGRNVKDIGKINQFAVRFGGEEFCMVLLQPTEEGAEIVGERIRRKIEEHKFIYEGQQISVTASIGIAETKITPDCLKDESFQGESFLDRVNEYADKALYKAKQSGKNRVELAVL